MQQPMFHIGQQVIREGLKPEIVTIQSGIYDQGWQYTVLIPASMLGDNSGTTTLSEGEVKRYLENGEWKDIE